MAAALVLVMLLTPAVQTVNIEERLPVVALVMDESTSMNYPEATGQALAGRQEQRMSGHDILRGHRSARSASTGIIAQNASREGLHFF